MWSTISGVPLVGNPTEIYYAYTSSVFFLFVCLIDGDKKKREDRPIRIVKVESLIRFLKFVLLYHSNSFFISVTQRRFKVNSYVGTSMMIGVSEWTRLV